MPTPVHAKTSDTEMNDAKDDILCATDEEILHEPNTSESSANVATAVSYTDVSHNLTTKLDEISCHIKPMPSLAEDDKNTKIGKYTIITTMSNNTCM